MSAEEAPALYSGRRPQSQGWKPKNVIWTAIVAALVIGSILWLLNLGPFNKDSSKVADPGTASTTECVRVQLDPNASFNVVTKTIDTGYAINNRYEDLAAMKKDPRNLAFRAWTMGLYPEDASNWQPLIEGECLSQRGVDLYNRVYQALNPAGSELVSYDENAVAPANYTNSGMEARGPVINGNAGIDGDRAAIRYTVKLTGSSQTKDFYVLKRCGNPAFENPPSLPIRQIPATPQPQQPTVEQPCTNCGVVNPPPVVNPCDINPSLPECNPNPPVCTDCSCNPSLPGCQPQCDDCTCTSNCPQPTCPDGSPIPPNGLCNKVDEYTPRGPSVPGQNGHVNSDPGPGEYRAPEQMTTPPPTPRQNPTTRPTPTPAPDVTPLPAPISTPAPDPGVVPPSGAPGSSEGRSDGVVVAPSGYIVNATQSQFALAA